jgi:hypothetical protein
MIQLNQSDFRSSDSFELWWRWANPKRVMLSESELAQIQPLTEKKAQEIWQTEFVYITELWRYRFNSTLEPVTSSSLFEWVQHIDISVANKEAVQQHLTTFQSQGNQIVIVMWEPTIAVAVPWHVFCTHFWSFCYPVTDDVSVWPISELWGLQYDHQDQLIFGRTRLPLLDEEARRPPHVQIRPLTRREELIHLIQANKIVAAIRLYHDDTGAPYREAKDVVEKLAAEINEEKSSS